MVSIGTEKVQLFCIAYNYSKKNMAELTICRNIKVWTNYYLRIVWMWLLSWMVSYNCKMVSAVDQTSSEMFYPKPVTWRRKRAHQQYFGTNDQRCQPQAREGKNKKVHLKNQRNLLISFIWNIKQYLNIYIVLISKNGRLKIFLL